jgi:hypothetical protein
LAPPSPRTGGDANDARRGGFLPPRTKVARSRPTSPPPPPGDDDNGENETTQKRPGKSANAVLAERVCCYDWIDDDSRIRILSFLDPSDLTEACLVSAQFARDSLDERLPAMSRCAAVAIPQTWERGELARAVESLARGSSFGRSVTSLRIVSSPSSDPANRIPLSQPPPPRFRVRFEGFEAPGITGLDLSEGPRDPAAIERAARELLPFLPDAQHLSCPPGELGLASEYWAGLAPPFRSLTWHGGETGFEGLELMYFTGLRDLCLDDAVLVFSWEAFAHQTFEEGHHWRILYCCSKNLERVSLRSLKYKCRADDRAAPRAVPPSGLVKFVRRARSLKWFRSDLTPESVALLKAERPDVTFAS